jgi:hypothetical protein
VLFPDSFIFHLQSLELAARAQSQEERRQTGRERQSDEPAGQVPEPGASIPEIREAAAQTAQRRQRGRAEPDGQAECERRADRGLHELAPQREHQPVGTHFHQTVRGTRERLDEARQDFDQAGLRLGVLSGA